LEGLRDFPTAFASNYDEERHVAAENEATRSPTADRVIFGAFEDASLIGMIGLQRETRQNLRHKTTMGGVYVSPRLQRNRV
jgi:hypothetical protein